MRTRHRGRFAFIIVAMMMAGGVIARDYDKQAAEAAGAQMDAVTVFVDADWAVARMAPRVRSPEPTKPSKCAAIACWESKPIQRTAIWKAFL